MRKQRPSSNEPPSPAPPASGAVPDPARLESGADAARLKLLAARYWSPLYQYLVSRHFTEREAMDAVEDFFIYAFRSQLFSKTDADCGRLRCLLLAALQDFLAKVYGRASGRRPRCRAGVASPTELLAKACSKPDWPPSGDPGETLFHKAWLQEVVTNTLRELREECHKKGQVSHFDLFRARTVAPRFEGALPPPLAKQPVEPDLLSVQVARQIQAAKRSFQKILAREIRSYTVSETDAAQEERDVLELLHL